MIPDDSLPPLRLATFFDHPEFDIRLDRAWGVCRITGYERRILHYIREHTWHESRPSCEVNITDIARIWGIHRQHICSAFKQLVAGKLIAGPRRECSLVTDYLSWASDRLSPRDIAYILEGEKADRLPIKSKNAIPRSLQTAVFERDTYRCLCCNSHLQLSIDHIIPESKGGPTEIDNLQVLCRSCNSSKNSKTIDYRTPGKEAANGHS